MIVNGRTRNEGRHDRDHNAAVNLKRPAIATGVPGASPTGNGGTAAEMVSAAAGKVTPARCEYGQHDMSGQERTVRTFLIAASLTITVCGAWLVLIR